MSRLLAERLAGYRDANPANLDPRITRDDLLQHIDAVEAELAEQLEWRMYTRAAADQERDAAIARAEAAEKRVAELIAERRR